jgi:hypothetical protein
LHSTEKTNNKKRTRERSGSAYKGESRGLPFEDHLTGGQGVLEAPAPAALLPVEGDEPEFAELVGEPDVDGLLFAEPLLDDPALGDPALPAFPLLDAPVFGVGPAFGLEFAPDVPGVVPQGEFPAVDPGVLFGFVLFGFVVFGLIVDG